jgi:signal transduction histidine kinase
VVRHSSAHACAITLATGTGRVALQVEDDGSGGGERSGESAGLAGLAERARLLQGTLEAGARPEGGFRVRMTLPLGTA